MVEEEEGRKEGRQRRLAEAERQAEEEGGGSQLKNPRPGAAGNGQRGQGRDRPGALPAPEAPLPSPGQLLPNSLLMFER